MVKKPETGEVLENVIPKSCEIEWMLDDDGNLVLKGLSCETEADTEAAYQAMDRAKEFTVMKKPIKSS